MAAAAATATKLGNQNTLPELLDEPATGPAPPPYQAIEPDSCGTATMAMTRPKIVRSSSSSSSVLSKSSVSSDGSDDSLDNELLDESLQYIRDRKIPLSPQTSGKLSKPIAIPQIQWSAVVPHPPFARAYCPELADHGIDLHTFIKFIDQINLVGAPEPTLFAVGVTGAVIGSGPFPPTQIAGGVAQAAAFSGVYMISMRRVKKYLAKANEELFNPHGLKAEILTAKALRDKLELCPSSTFAAPSIRKVSTSSSQNLAPSTSPRGSISSHPSHKSNTLRSDEFTDFINARCESLEGKTQPLEYDNMPEPQLPDSLYKRISANNVRRNLRGKDKKLRKQSLKAEKKVAKEAEKAEKAAAKEAAKGKSPIQGEIESIKAEKKKARQNAKDEKEYEKETARLNREERKVRLEADKQLAKAAMIVEPDRKAEKTLEAESTLEKRIAELDLEKQRKYEELIDHSRKKKSLSERRDEFTESRIKWLLITSVEEE